jgi:hypothetical protein
MPGKGWDGEADFVNAQSVADALTGRYGTRVHPHSIMTWLQVYPKKYPGRPQPPAPAALVIASTPRGTGSPRWRPDQVSDWLDWYGTTPHEAGNAAFTEGNTEQRKRWGDITPAQLAAFEQVVRKARQENRTPTLQAVRDATGLGYIRGRQLMAGHGLKTMTETLEAADEELADRVRDLIREHGADVTVGRVQAHLGVRATRARRLIGMAGGIPPKPGPDIDRLRAAAVDGRVMVKNVTDTYDVHASTVSRMLSRNLFPNKARKGKVVWLDLDDVLEAFKDRQPGSGRQ